MRYAVETQVHADHVTGARRLKEELGSKIALPGGVALCVRQPGARRRASSAIRHDRVGAAAGYVFRSIRGDEATISPPA
jgi:glyoxylase-like metal-dependent hydrolase (beta-lactamase superfamily II)